MRTLYLLRHAKSDWGDPGLDDFDRPLAPRGRRAAPAVAQWMNANGCAPDFVLCSAARRAVETWALVSEVLESAPETETTEDLYHASPAGLLGLAKALPDRYAAAMMIGHNPGFHVLADALVGEGPDDLLRLLAAGYPTAALAGIAFDAPSWSEIEPGAGRLTCFVRPRALE